MFFHTTKPRVSHQHQISSTFWTKVTISLREFILGLLQPLRPELGYQIDLRFLKMAAMISQTQKHWVWYQNYYSCTIRTKVTISLHEVGLGLLQPSHPDLDLRIDLRLRIAYKYPKSAGPSRGVSICLILTWPIYHYRLSEVRKQFGRKHPSVDSGLEMASNGPNYPLFARPLNILQWLKFSACHFVW